MLDVGAHPPMAKMTRVSQGMAPSVSVHLVAAETVNETCYADSQRTPSLTQLFECNRNFHRGGVYKCEE